MHSSKYRDRRHSHDRRDRSHSSRRDRDSRRRSPSPGPSRGRSPSPLDRDENELPFEFGRPEPKVDLNDYNVLKRMDTAYINTPLDMLSRCLRNKVKIKVWIRGSNEIRSLCTGYLEAFDKHWNMFVSSSIEYYVLPKHKKTPFLLDTSLKWKELERENLGEKISKENSVKKVTEEVPPKERVRSARAEKRAALKMKMKERIVYKRDAGGLFIRGDSVAMFGFCEPLNDPHFFPLHD